MKVTGRMKFTQLKTRSHPILPTGLLELDRALLGGFQKGALIHFYGQPGSGKTTFAMQIIRNIIYDGWKAIWVDCNGAFSLAKFQRILGQDQLLNNFMMVRPQSFHNQTEIIQHLNLYLEHVAVIVVDPITHFYRAERFREGSQGFFQELIEDQLGTLMGIAHLQKILIIVINYSGMNRGGQPEPLVSSGFQRVEHYRFSFKTAQPPADPERPSQKEFLIELAPDKFSQNRVFRFRISPNGIESLNPVEERKDGAEQ